MRFVRLPLNQTQPGPTRVIAKHVFGHQNHVSAGDCTTVAAVAVNVHNNTDICSYCEVIGRIILIFKRTLDG